MSGVTKEVRQEVQIIADTLAEYLKTNKPFNRWFEQGPVKVYVRRQKVVPSREFGIADALTLAHIVVEEDHRSKGTFKELREVSEQLVRRYIPRGVVYVENVNNPRLAKHLAAQGYTRKAIGQDDQSFYRAIQ